MFVYSFCMKVAARRPDFYSENNYRAKDLVCGVCQIYHVRAVHPRSDFQHSSLRIERPVSHVGLAVYFEHDGLYPHYVSGAFHEAQRMSVFYDVVVYAGTMRTKKTRF
jgi:hypothetical protein